MNNARGRYWTTELAIIGSVYVINTLKTFYKIYYEKVLSFSKSPVSLNLTELPHISFQYACTVFFFSVKYFVSNTTYLTNVINPVRVSHKRLLHLYC